MSTEVNPNSSPSASQQQITPVQRKLQKILDLKLESDKDLIESLKYLSSFFNENSVRTRRSLRSTIEKRSLTLNDQFEECFRVVKQQLDQLNDTVTSMSTCCEDMTQRLKNVKAQTQELINKTTQIQNENQELNIKSCITEGFIERFQLTPDELNALRTTRDGFLHPQFFNVLKRVKSIYQDCKLLLRTNQQTIGLEIMEQMALHQESAYERLYRWLQSECRLLTTESPEISTLIGEALDGLKERQVLFKYILDEYGTARRNALVRGFIDALTRGGPGGTPRPIELSSHDPLRYVGDMLAWTHQSTASEKEYAEILLRKLKDWNELQKTIQTLLGYITEGLCRPLRVRLEQVLVSQHEPVTLYKLTNLLKFYETTIKQLLPIECQLVLVLDEVSNLSSKMFLNALNATATRLIEKVDIPTNDLNLSDELRRTLALLRDILETHSTSMIPFESKRVDFQQIVYSIIDPLLQMCSLSATKLGVIEMAVYLVNCISAIRTTLAVFAFTDEKIDMLEGQIEANTDTLIGEQATYILLRTDLLDAYRIVEKQQQESNTNVTALALKPGMDTVTLKAAMVKFDLYLASPDLYIMPQLKYLTSAVIREKIKKRSVELICAAYASLYSAIMDPKNNYANPYSIMPHTPEQIVKLLS
ncbi:unnamed protein product [Rotaria sordida]|uniref:Conserved oligomeric Golgi complex subunit 6 n=1 Tax=Rotaria sordida TaxID=392033 RepID=A0A813VTY6_9BILA|nr:unnamed protein product [Rotaria sordida]CAF0958248.1 unnamed protein product [Rotaria sordida]CAF3711419.1 unnamed protein product [Rotaria sordida]CAF3753389.1 unnamed protein product [Rotaria sordida]CAF3854443.1 unnamed protein product [Rotaria sordida]